MIGGIGTKPQHPRLELSEPVRADAVQRLFEHTNVLFTHQSGHHAACESRRQMAKRGRRSHADHFRSDGSLRAAGLIGGAAAEQTVTLVRRLGWRPLVVFTARAAGQTFAGEEGEIGGISISV
jgi:hypothetical protein